MIRQPVRWAIKPLIWAASLTPFLLLIWNALHDGLGANPIERITLTTGKAALVLLLAALAVTPLRRITGWNQLIKVRRLLGLFAFFYGTLHFLTYVVLDQFFDFGAIAADIAKRPYITVGFTAFLLLIPLAATSTRGMVRRLGKRWVKIHRLVYVSGILAILHFYWKRSAKADIQDPLLYAAILLILFSLRLPAFRRKAKPRES